MKKIKKVAVIGAGTMGSGIAGQVANAGIEVWLLDLPSDDNPNALAERGLERLRETQGLMSKEVESYIHIGNTRDDFHQLEECDWVAEAVVERLDIKKELYKQIDEVCSDDTLISSNTSSIPIRLLVEDMPSNFRQRFAIPISLIRCGLCHYLNWFAVKKPAKRSWMYLLRSVIRNWAKAWWLV